MALGKFALYRCGCISGGFEEEGQRVNAYVILLDVARLLSTDVVPFCTPTYNLWSARCPKTTQLECIGQFFTSPTGGKYLSIILIRISFIRSVVEHFFICLKAISFFSCELSADAFCLFFYQFFFCCWWFRSAWTLRNLVPYWLSCKYFSQVVICLLIFTTQKDCIYTWIAFYRLFWWDLFLYFFWILSHRKVFQLPRWKFTQIFLEK